MVKSAGNVPSPVKKRPPLLLSLTFATVAAFLTASCGKKPETPAAPPPPPMEAAMRSWARMDKFLRQTLAREHFLSSAPVWRDEHTRKIADLGHRYNVLHDRWLDGQLPSPVGTAEESEKQ